MAIADRPRSRKRKPTTLRQLNGVKSLATGALVGVASAGVMMLGSLFSLAGLATIVGLAVLTTVSNYAFRSHAQKNPEGWLAKSLQFFSSDKAQEAPRQQVKHFEDYQEKYAGEENAWMHLDDKESDFEHTHEASPAASGRPCSTRRSDQPELPTTEHAQDHQPSGPEA